MEINKMIKEFSRISFLGTKYDINDDKTWKR